MTADSVYGGAQLLSSEQRLLLDLLLSKPFDGHEELIRQAATVRTGGSSCDCGCPSFSLILRAY